MVNTMAIIGIAASASMPAYDPVQQSQLSWAATSVADVTRFSRERARDFGSPHGVEVDKVSQRVRVFRLDLDGDRTLSLNWTKSFPTGRTLCEAQHGINVGV